MDNVALQVSNTSRIQKLQKGTLCMGSPQESAKEYG